MWNVSQGFTETIEKSFLSDEMKKTYTEITE